MPDASSAVLKALAVTCELTGTELSPAAVQVLARDLGAYPEHMVVGALNRCRKELRSRLTLADIVARLDDGRPGPEEAWAMIRGALEDERVTVVWTEEMAQASGAARQLVVAGDPVAARMAFLESYRAQVARARDLGEPPTWTPSLGYDAAGRDGPLLEACRLGRLEQAKIAGLLRSPPVDSSIAQLVEPAAKKLLGRQP